MAGTRELIYSMPAAARWCFGCGQSRQFTDYVYLPARPGGRPFVERRCTAGHVDGDIQPGSDIEGDW
jgi:hypothetical protein